MLLLEAPDISGLANLGALALVAALAIKEFFAYLNKRSSGNGANGSSVIKLDLGPLHQKLDALLRASETTAGAKSSDWWELAFSRIVKQCLLDHENQVRRLSEQEAAEARQQMLEGLKSLERQVAMAVAEISRQIRDR